MIQRPLSLVAAPSEAASCLTLYWHGRGTAGTAAPCEAEVRANLETDSCEE